MTDLVRLKKFEEITGITARAVEAKISHRIWRHGKEYITAPDGKHLVSIKGYEKWAWGENG